MPVAKKQEYFGFQTPVAVQGAFSVILGVLFLFFFFLHVCLVLADFSSFCSFWLDILIGNGPLADVP